MENNGLPVISTKRCHLRPFKQSDMFAFMEYRNNEQWMCYQGFKGLTYEEYCQILLVQPQLKEGCQIAIIHRENQKLLGDLYLKKEAEILWLGYTIHPLYQRQGYIYEVIQGLIDWSSEREIAFLKAGVLSENTASKNLLKKLGFQFSAIEDDEEIYYLQL
ncbi:GNAT family N-acetyltransferase [Beduini massiliensis]|uniref:GNAT family N-acetyltransferase n=1 Tax=Beduini massiliensis TaxID=1585974 RepID=UPI00059AAD97|nr:GNAT family N-acetyltransferase [Beduini massiliensis]